MGNPSEGKPVVLVTGSSSGIGYATAERFATRGWRVFASMRRPEKGEALRAAATARGWALTTPALDVTREDSVSAVVADILGETEGRLDVLVNNAGYYAYGPLEETSPDELRDQLETNVVGVHRVTRAVLPAMRARRAGAVVTIGSISGRVAIPLCGPYHASKWALEGMIEAWRLELYPFGVRMALVEPGAFVTRLHDNERGPAASGAASPYADLLANYRRQTASLRRAANLRPVVDAIERAATARHPRLRWPVGPSAFAARFRPFVPDRLYEWILHVVFRMRQPRPPDPIRTDASMQL